MTVQPQLDILELLKDGRHFAEKRGDRIHIVDSLTGNSIIMYADPQTAKLPTALVESSLPNGATVWIEEGLNPHPQGGQREIAYSPVIVHLICQQIVEGAGITSICNQPGFPKYNVLRKWAHQHPWIDEHLNQARRDRAETLRDKAVQTAEEAESRDPIDKASLQVDTYKWAAGVDNEKYNPKTKVEATINTPTQIVVYTGIDRTEARDVTAIPKELQKYD